MVLAVLGRGMREVRGWARSAAIFASIDDGKWDTEERIVREVARLYNEWVGNNIHLPGAKLRARRGRDDVTHNDIGIPSLNGLQTL